jgi:hypothetical protein
VQLGRYEAAAEHLHQALIRCRQGADRINEAWTLDSLGTLHTRLERASPAAEFRRQALTIFQEIGNRLGEASALNGLGEAEQAAGRPAHAPDPPPPAPSPTRSAPGINWPAPTPASAMLTVPSISGPRPPALPTRVRSLHRSRHAAGRSHPRPPHRARRQQPRAGRHRQRNGSLKRSGFSASALCPDTSNQKIRFIGTCNRFNRSSAGRSGRSARDGRRVPAGGPPGPRVVRRLIRPRAERGHVVSTPRPHGSAIPFWRAPRRAGRSRKHTTRGDAPVGT